MRKNRKTLSEKERLEKDRNRVEKLVRSFERNEKQLTKFYGDAVKAEDKKKAKEWKSWLKESNYWKNKTVKILKDIEKELGEIQSN